MVRKFQFVSYYNGNIYIKEVNAITTRTKG